LIIACPECTSPFQVLDGQIAALLQIECPSCTFRMILDFEAANDASLREEGMGYAQGFRDEAAYRQAVGAGEISHAPSEAPRAAAKPELRAVPTPEPTPEPEPAPVADRPEPVRRPVSTPAPTPTPVQPQPVQPQPVQPQPVQPQPVEPQAVPKPQPSKPPVRARPTLIAHTAPPPVRPELTPPPQQQPVQPQTEAAVDTHVGPPPTAEVAAPVEVSPPADDAQLEVAADEFSVELDDEPEVVPAQRPRPVVEAEPPVRTPPHSPSPTPSVTKPAPEEAITPPDVPIVPKPEEAETKETGKRKGGALRTVFLMLLLLILMGAAGLMGWSVIETQDPNPLPMLKEKFGIDLGFGIPAQPDAAEAGGEAAEPAADKAAAQ
jgi:hypothetical protein